MEERLRPCGTPCETSRPTTSAASSRSASCPGRPWRRRGRGLRWPANRSPLVARAGLPGAFLFPWRLLLGFQLGEQLLEVVTLAQGVEILVLLHVGEVLEAGGDGLAEQSDGSHSMLLGRWDCIGTLRPHRLCIDAGRDIPRLGKE